MVSSSRDFMSGAMLVGGGVGVFFFFFFFFFFFNFKSSAHVDQGRSATGPPCAASLRRALEGKSGVASEVLSKPLGTEVLAVSGSVSG